MQAFFSTNTLSYEDMNKLQDEIKNLASLYNLEFEKHEFSANEIPKEEHFANIEQAIDAIGAKVNYGEGSIYPATWIETKDWSSSNNKLFGSADLERWKNNYEVIINYKTAEILPTIEIVHRLKDFSTVENGVSTVDAEVFAIEYSFKDVENYTYWYKFASDEDWTIDISEIRKTTITFFKNDTLYVRIDNIYGETIATNSVEVTTITEQVNGGLLYADNYEQSILTLSENTVPYLSANNSMQYIRENVTNQYSLEVLDKLKEKIEEYDYYVITGSSLEYLNVYMTNVIRRFNFVSRASNANNVNNLFLSITSDENDPIYTISAYGSGVNEELYTGKINVFGGSSGIFTNGIFISNLPFLKLNNYMIKQYYRSTYNVLKDTAEFNRPDTLPVGFNPNELYSRVGTVTYRKDGVDYYYNDNMICMTFDSINNTPKMFIPSDTTIKEYDNTVEYYKMETEKMYDYSSYYDRYYDIEKETYLLKKRDLQQAMVYDWEEFANRITGDTTRTAVRTIYSNLINGVYENEKQHYIVTKTSSGASIIFFDNIDDLYWLRRKYTSSSGKISNLLDIYIKSGYMYSSDSTTSTEVSNRVVTYKMTIDVENMLADLTWVLNYAGNGGSTFLSGTDFSQVSLVSSKEVIEYLFKE